MEEPSAAYRAALGRLEAAAPGTRRAEVDALIAHAETDPDRRQPVTDAVCSWLRTAPVDAAAAGERHAVLQPLIDRLRAGGPAPWDGISVDLSGCTLGDADFSGCRLDAAEFADTRFHGTAVFAGAAFADAAFQRAVFYGDAVFTGARFGGDAEFGRARFRRRADFTGAVFSGTAWFGRGADTWWDDDAAWETVEEIDPAPWEEPNEDDPNWPVAVLIEDYQDWEEGGDGARFLGDASFRDVRFDGPAWFHYARFGAAATFAGARFAGRAHLDQPAVDLTGAHWGGDTGDGEPVWPLGWTARPVAAGARDGAADLVPDASVAPYTGQLADPDPEVRSAGLQILARLGDDRPEARQRVVATWCAFLRIPLPFDLRADGRTPEQDALLRLRREAQRTLAERLRPGPGQWKGMDLWLCGATFVDLDFSGCEADYADFAGAQFHGTTRFDGSGFDHAVFTLDGSSGRASFHGDVVFGTDPPGDVVLHGTAT
ncbi:pentapeptide repeat-containing protein [Actinomadura madurae]|uniref:pentapeptide repeat-containing protein n=1 Tax=Actinomadura madurae TaxID=1993 RepID=UPI002026904A|nr:pentapeptide repeat-containing protein [Actinomadura madurae]URN00714.1 pentapeptide repeat-containing protein [Actinomadura madurae]URN02863.1 pentapeptide repeat-containing protein [Actinomadura madurae]